MKLRYSSYCTLSIWLPPLHKKAPPGIRLGFRAAFDLLTLLPQSCVCIQQLLGSVLQLLRLFVAVGQTALHEVPLRIAVEGKLQQNRCV